MSLKQVAKVMNKSVQSLIREVDRGVDRGEKNFKKGDRRLPISYNNGDTGANGATSPIPVPERKRTQHAN